MVAITVVAAPVFAVFEITSFRFLILDMTIASSV